MLQPRLHRLPSSPRVEPAKGVRVIDDSTLDKHHAKKILLVTWHWSGKPRDVVRKGRANSVAA